MSSPGFQLAGKLNISLDMPELVYNHSRSIDFNCSFNGLGADIGFFICTLASVEGYGIGGLVSQLDPLGHNSSQYTQHGDEWTLPDNVTQWQPYLQPSYGSIYPLWTLPKSCLGRSRCTNFTAARSQAGLWQTFEVYQPHNASRVPQSSELLNVSVCFDTL